MPTKISVNSRVRLRPDVAKDFENGNEVFTVVEIVMTTNPAKPTKSRYLRVQDKNGKTIQWSNSSDELVRTLYNEIAFERVTGEGRRSARSIAKAMSNNDAL